MSLVSINELRPATEFTVAGSLDLCEKMAEVMWEHRGLGISANQIGINNRVIVILGEELIPMVNPKIVGTSDEELRMDELDVQYPGLPVKVKRPRRIRVRFTEPNGNVKTEMFDGMISRYIQHQIDVLDGISFLSKASPIHRQQALTKWKRIKKSLDKKKSSN